MSDESRWRILGDPTEGALLTLALKACLEIEAVRHTWPRRAEMPFSSASRMMATQNGHTHTPNKILLKGAPEMILPLCRHGVVDDQTRVLKQAETMANRALRALAVAAVHDAEIDEAAGFEQFRGRALCLGLVGEMAPPREEVKQSITLCKSAGVRPIIVTGDHQATAFAIALDLGIASEGDRSVTGKELEAMPEQDLLASLDHLAVFARVHPAQKLRIIEALQTQGNVVALTGDGVNDAPALARADVGVAMGITGTEVAKSAAKVVISDDNFATIVKAVEQGRLVYANIQKLLLFLFATSLDEVLILLVALLAGTPLPLAAVQILWINLVTEGTLTLNLVMEGPEGDEMKRPPVDPCEPLITRQMLRRMAVMVPTSVTATLCYFFWRLSTDASLESVQTETFTLLAVCQWFNALNCQSERASAFGKGLFKNRWLLGGLLLANLMQLAVVYTAPLNALFHTTPISLAHFFLIGAVASSVLWVEEIRKWAIRRVRHS